MDEKRSLEVIPEGLIEAPIKRTKKEILAIEREKARIEREAEKQARKEVLEQQKLQREKEKQEREAARLVEKEQKEQAKKQKQRERELAKEAKEREKEAKEREREQAKKEKEIAKNNAKKEKEAQQPKLNSFFSVVQKKPIEQPAENISKYESTFLKYHLKANCEMFSTRSPKESPADCLKWLSSKPSYVPGPFLSSKDFQAQLNIGRDLDQLLGQVTLRHIQLCENVRPPFIGTVKDLDSGVLRNLCLDPTSTTTLPLSYDYDSELEWAPGDEDDDDLINDEESDDDGEGSDVGSFLASDDDDFGSSRRRVISSIDPIIRWNDGAERDFFRQFSMLNLSSLPLTIGSHKAANAVATAPAKPVDLPPQAIVAILKTVQGHTGTKALLLETLYHDLNSKFASLTRSGLRNVIETHAKKEKSGWVVVTEKQYLLNSE